jgi:hypothetical protein
MATIDLVKAIKIITDNIGDYKAQMRGLLEAAEELDTSLKEMITQEPSLHRRVGAAL